MLTLKIHFHFPLAFSFRFGPKFKREIATSPNRRSFQFPTTGYTPINE